MFVSPRTLHASPSDRRVIDIMSALKRRSNPILFTVIMGTGAISGLFASFPYGKGSQGMMSTSLVFFFLTLLLFIIFTSLCVAKYTTQRGAWAAMLEKPVMSLYLGCFPQGITTLLNVAVEVIHGHYDFGGPSFLYGIWALYWVVVAITIACGWIGVHLMFVKQNHSLSNMTAMWMLPAVTLSVTASCGGVISLALQQYSPYHALITVAASFFLVTVGLMLGFMIMAIYFARLVIYGLPPNASILTVFNPLGPTAQSGYSMYLIGQNIHTLLPYPNAGQSVYLSTPQFADILYLACMSISLLLWVLATMWLLYALLALQSSIRLRTSPRFKVSFWGMVFPNSVYAKLTIMLGDVFDSQGFRIFGSIYAIVVFGTWVCVAARSLLALRVILAPPPSAESATGVERYFSQTKYEEEYGHDYEEDDKASMSSYSQTDCEADHDDHTYLMHS